VRVGDIFSQKEHSDLMGRVNGSTPQSVEPFGY